MSNSTAAAVLTSPGLDEVLRAVRALPGIGTSTTPRRISRPSSGHAVGALADLCQKEPAPDHTVHVHVRGDRDLDRVRRLAVRVGGRFSGRTELAPL
ncbi:hypothetical protein [Streptomyces sp. NPDC051636]|uniref:hypothetical protein n=1 Tax=Streptomyces sp. NPDC051636 TaxID=3365663 RepID=UPI0037BB0EDA